MRSTARRDPVTIYTSPLQFYEVYHAMRQSALSMVAPENTTKYHAQVQAAQALYVDYLFALGRWGDGDSITPARALTPEERAQWFEHNVYYALQTSDEYVWLYSENMNWWENRDLPPGLRTAVESAKRKQAQQEPLGFEVADRLPWLLPR